MLLAAVIIFCATGASTALGQPTYTEFRKFTPEGVGAGDEFGTDLDLQLSTRIPGATVQAVLVGAPGDDSNGSNAGAAYLIRLGNFSTIAKYTDASGEPFDLFGTTVALQSPRAAISALGDRSSINSNETVGSVSVFRTSTGVQFFRTTPPLRSWPQGVATIDLDGSVLAILHDSLGPNLSIILDVYNVTDSNNIALIGRNTRPAGTSVFADLPTEVRLLTGGVSPQALVGVRWGSSQTIGDVFQSGFESGSERVDRQSIQAGGRLGDAMDDSASWVAVLQPLRKRFWVYDIRDTGLINSGPIYGRALPLQLPDTGAALDIAVTEDLIVVSDSLAREAYVYAAPTGRHLATLRPSDFATTSPTEFFGSAVAIEEGVIAVGASRDNQAGNRAGAMYLYVLPDCDGSGSADLIEISRNPLLDCDGNGQIDACEIDANGGVDGIGGMLDCDGNGELDACQINAAGGVDGLGGVLDCNGNGSLDACELAADPALDCDLNGVIDSCQIAVDATVDCDENGILDACQIDASGGFAGIGGDLDCNSNGVLDSCEIVSGTASDRNGNGVLDVCEIAGDPSLDCDGNGVLDTADLTDNSDRDCDSNGVLDDCELADDSSLDLDGNGRLDACDISDDPSADCDGNGVIDTVQIQADLSLDCDTNGRLDSCDIASDPSLDCDSDGDLDSCQLDADPLSDRDANGRLDVCDIADDPSIDCDSDGTIDVFQLLDDPQLDCDANGQIDSCEIASDPALDRDLNSVLDTCDISGDPSLDCDGNGLIDSFEINDDPTLDCDANGHLDSCDIAGDATLDCDDNGRLDGCEILDDPALDCDDNGVLDVCDLSTDPMLDRDGNGRLDACDSADNPDLDCDGDGMLDVFQIDDAGGIMGTGGSLDLNANGQLDSCDIADGTSNDCDGNGVPDEVQPDCTRNGIPDVCDIRDDPNVYDCNANGIPDGICEDLGLSVFQDCNQDGVSDACQIDENPFLDCDGNGILDECDLFAPVLEVVFVVDTSNSDADEAMLIGDTIAGIEADLTSAGVAVSTRTFGVIDTLSPLFDDVVDPGQYVETIYGPVVDGMPSCCNLITTAEDYAPAAAQVAANFNWFTERSRVIVTFGDEGPYRGDPCNDPGDDRDVVTGTIAVARDNDVRLVPVLTTGFSPCAAGLAADMALETGGAFFDSDQAGPPLRERLSSLLIDLATGDDMDGDEVLDECQIALDPGLDCNGNGMLDRIELNMGLLEDCDGNDIPDVCDYPLVDITTGEVSPLDATVVSQLVIPAAPESLGDVTLTLRASGDLGAIAENIAVRINGVSQGLLFVQGFSDCAFTAETDQLVITEADWNNLVDGEDLVIELTPSAQISGATCPESFLQATLVYRPLVDDDCNGNGRSDSLCDVFIDPDLDQDGNGVIDSCEGKPTCLADVNLDGQVNGLDFGAWLGAFNTGDPLADQNQDGVINGLDFGAWLGNFNTGCG